MRIAIVSTALALSAALSACGGASDPEAPESPVITPSDAWNAYPSALVRGVLESREGCLLLNEEVVFWPKGTGWDAGSQAVTFDGLPSTPIGEEFRGGGGHYDHTADFETWLGGAAGRKVEDCLARTSATGVVFAYASAGTARPQ